jgi:hypothetical protein
MAAAAEILVGAAVINGIQGTIATTSAAPATHVMNTGTRTLSHDFKMEEIPAQNGATIATIVACQRRKILELEFFPSGTTRANAIAEVAELTALTAYAVITITQSGTPALASAGLQKVGGSAATYNLMSGMTTRESRDGILSVVMRLEAVQTNSSDSLIFAALAIV